MPFIVVARPDMEHTAGKALGGLGRNIAEIGQTLSAARQREKALEAEKMRAEASLMREKNLAAQREAREAERTADREASMQGMEQLGQRSERAAYEASIQEAMRSPQGALGPFGALNPRALAGGLRSGLEAKQRSQARLELAARMSPEAARMYLARETENEKKIARDQAWKDEAQALQDAIADGVLDERKAKLYARALQTAAREGKEPGQVWKLLAKEYDMHVKVKGRLRAWDQADKDAATLIQSIEQAASSVQDPVAQAALRGKVAQARGEWERTEHQSFRSQSDPEKTLGALREILFLAQAEAGTPMDLTQAERTQQESAVRNDAFTPERGAATSEWARGMGGGRPPASAAAPRAQASSGGRRSTDTGKRASAEEIAAGEPARRAEREKRGLPGRTLDPNAPKRQLKDVKDAERLHNFVLERAQKTLSVEGDRKQKVMQLRDEIARDLGLDPSSPDVFAIVKQALEAAYGKTGATANAAR